MNILKNKKASLILKTLGSVIGLTASTALLISPGVSQPNNVNTNIKSNDLNRSFNEVTKDNLLNPEFYFDSFNFRNPDQGAETPVEIPIAKDEWNRIRINLETYRQFSSNPSYKYIMEKISDLELWADSENFIIREALRNAGQIDVWENIKETLGFQEFIDVAGEPDELHKNIMELSGLVSGQSSTYRIRAIENRQAKIVNLLTGTVTDINIPGDYKTVVTIAEIDYPAVQEDIKIDFSYSSTAFTGLAARGSLIIRNKNDQISTDTLVNNKDNLEIFGRWTNLGNNSVGTNNFRSTLDNFVLSKTDDDKLLVVARLRDGEQLTNIRTEGISNFGIINSQIDDLPIYPDVDIVDSIDFYSTNLLMTNANSSNVPGTTNPQINKKYEFYVGDETELNLILFYKNIDENIYKDLYDFDGDKVSSTVKQNISIGVKGGNPVNLSTKNVEFSDEVLAELNLPETRLEELGISLKTEKSISNNLFKQGIYLNDLMALAISGSPIPSSGGVTISLGNRITDKIFFEDPGFVPVVPVVPEVSTTSPIKWVNSENQVITELSRIYEAWSREIDPIGREKLGQKFYNKVDYELSGGKYRNITWKNQSNDYTGKEMYSNIVEEYAIYQQIISQLISSTSSESTRNIYEIGPGGTAQNIVRGTLLSIENKAQRTLIIDNVKEIIDGSSPIKDLLIEQQLAELVRIKFSEMRTTLTNPISTFYYFEIKKYLDSELIDKTRMSTVDSFLIFDEENGLFNLKSKNPKILETVSQLTGSQKMESLFSLLYFGLKEYGTETTFFGNAIFGAASTNGGTESILDLFIGFNSNPKILSDFTSSVLQTQIDSVNIYDRLLSIFGYGINEITENSLKTGEEIKLEWKGDNLDKVITTIFNKFNPSSFEQVSILELNYQYNVFNSLITSANIYNSLTFRKYNPPKGVVSPSDDARKIVNILESGIVSHINVFAWSRIQEVGNDIQRYTNLFSEDLSETIRLSNQIKTEADILDRFIEEQNALFQINPFLNVRIVWPILVGLIAVGMIVISSMSLAGIRKNSKLSNRQVIKIILIVAILISIASLGLIGAVIVPGLL
ncbi:MAG: hypothetical protein ACRC7B_01315 [Metamycoplasmataceae bacterium]